MGVWKNTNIGGWGAYHVSDVPLIMGTTQRKQNTTPDEPEQAILIKNVMTAFAAFVKDPDNGLSKLGWPQYKPGTDSLIRLGFNNSGTISYGPAEQYDKNCPSLMHVGPEAYGIKKMKRLAARSLGLVNFAGQMLAQADA